MNIIESINQVIAAFKNVDQKQLQTISADVIRRATEPSELLFLYHGTDNPSWSPIKSKFGYFGTGVYLSDILTAGNHGDKIYRCKADIKNPLVVPADYLDDAGYESPSLMAVFQALGMQGLSEYIERMQNAVSLNSDCFYPDPEFTEFLNILGFDSVIAVYGEGSFEVVVLDPSKVSSEKAE